MASPAGALPPSPPDGQPGGGGASPAAWRKCVKYVDYARRSSPRVASLLRQLEARGCGLAAPDPIVCEDAFEGAPVAGAYDSVRRLVLMNPGVPAGVLTQAITTRTVTHELIHAWDHCRAVIDPADCRHLACTEVRAANLSGDCDFGIELARGALRDFSLRGRQQQCVRRRAELSVSMHPHCVAARRGVKATVDDVWEPCYADVSPFSTN